MGLMPKLYSGVWDLTILITSRTTVWVWIEEKCKIKINEVIVKPQPG